MLNRLEMLRIFCAAAEAGSFKDAATRLGVSPQAVTRAVQELEQAQGEVLFHRNTRGVQVTAFGEALAGRARGAVQQFDALFPTMGQKSAHEMQGTVRLTAPSSLGRTRLMPVLTRIAAAHPQISFDLRLSDQLADVVDEKIDIGVRVGFLRDNRFVARPVGKVHFHVLGTPDLIERVGKPKNIKQLDELPTTVWIDRSTGRPWPWLFAGGRQATPAGPRFVCDDADAECAAVLAGLAFGQIPGYLADELVASGRLVPVLPSVAPDPWDIFVYRPQRGPVPARIRLVFDELVSALLGS